LKDIKIFFDLETTGINPYTCEVIEGNFQEYINDKKTREYNFKSRVNYWCSDAAIIHKISKKECMSYPDKKDAYRNLLSWLPKDFTFFTFANKNTELGVINYDVAVLENELNLIGCGNYFLKNTFNMKAPISVHSLAKEAAKRQCFTPIKKKSQSGRMIQTFTQENVYRAIFGRGYRGHRAKIDVDKLVEIYYELLRLSNETRTFI